VFHDDQHGTAIISAAALLNGLELVGKKIGDVKVAVSGAGAAAIACLDLMVELGVRQENIFVCDSKGVIHDRREDRLDESKKRYVQKTSARVLADVMEGADVLLGCSAAGAVTPGDGQEHGRQADHPAPGQPRARDPARARQGGPPDCIIATGRSDYPNQVNNVLCFPYIFAARSTAAPRASPRR
jgi:malate dehydrogenase (oxaloacetate-decarboxylating)(NADP+)